MKYKVSKNKCLGGGLYLKCTILTFATIAYGGAVGAQYLNVKDAINRFNQYNWRVIGANKIAEAHKDSWIKQEKYGDSIIKVIGEAIANCVTGMGEFEARGKADTIVFAVTPKDINYSEENWNAVVLWNYLNILKYDRMSNTKREKETIWDEVYQNVFTHYDTTYHINDLDWKIKRAISDIKEYSKALNLEEAMQQFITTYKTVKDRAVSEFTGLPSDRKKRYFISPDIEIYSSHPARETKSSMHGEDYIISQKNFECVSGDIIKKPLKIEIGSALYYVYVLSIRYGGYAQFTRNKFAYSCDIITKVENRNEVELPIRENAKLSREEVEAVCEKVLKILWTNDCINTLDIARPPFKPDIPPFNEKEWRRDVCKLTFDEAIEQTRKDPNGQAAKVLNKILLKGANESRN